MYKINQGVIMKKIVGMLVVLIVLVGVGYAYYTTTKKPSVQVAKLAPVQMPAATQASTPAPAPLPVMPQIVQVSAEDAPDFLALNHSLQDLSYLSACLQGKADVLAGYHTCVCEQQDQKAISILQSWKQILAKHPNWAEPGVTLNLMQAPQVSTEVTTQVTEETASTQSAKIQFQAHTIALNPTVFMRVLEATKACVPEIAD